MMSKKRFKNSIKFNSPNINDNIKYADINMHDVKRDIMEDVKLLICNEKLNRSQFVNVVSSDDLKHITDLINSNKTEIKDEIKKLLNKIVYLSNKIKTLENSVDCTLNSSLIMSKEMK
jgi:K+/H+ antiporter YhaU regulatory subunit KhtT